MTEDPFSKFKAEVNEALVKALKELKAETPIVLDRAPAGLGDLAFPCFPLAKQLKKSPDAISRDIASMIKPQGMIDKVDVKGGYVNFTVKFDELAHDSLAQALLRKEGYGTPDKEHD